MILLLAIISVSLFVLTIIPIIVIFYKLWWLPLRFQVLMKSQGIRGPSYRFFHGNTKEIMRMKQQQTSNSEAAMDISHDIFPRIQPHFYSWIKLYGDNFLYWDGSQPEIVVTEPELIKEILMNKEGIFPKSKQKSYFKKLFGDGLPVAEGEKWFRKRKLANHAFHGHCLKDMLAAMSASVEAMLENWRSDQRKEIEVCSEFRLLSSDVISRTAFGSSYLEGKRIFDLLSKLSVLISKNMLKIRFFGLGKLSRTRDDIEADKIEQLLNDSVMEMVRRRQEKVTSGEAESLGNDYLGSLVKSQHDVDPKNRISVVDIIDECKTFYLVGHETVFSLLSWATFLLSIHTEWQDKAREEVFRLFGKQNPNPEGLAKLKTVNMILYETLRLYSPATFITRRTRSKVKLGKYEFPANVKVTIPLLAIHRNAEIWGRDAHMFKPERFDEGLAKAAVNGNAVGFLAFGYGARMCVGLNFSISEAKIALSMILQRYKLTLSSNYVHSPLMLLVVVPQHGIKVLLQPL